MTKIKTTVPCSDWFRGWGYGHTKLGKLTKTGENQYLWKGSAQGRHGNVITKSIQIEFRVTETGYEALSTEINRKVIDPPTTRSLPDKRDVDEAIRVLGSY